MTSATLGGCSHMTSALRGRGLVQKETIVLIGCVNATVTWGRAATIVQNVYDVIKDGPLLY